MLYLGIVFVTVFTIYTIINATYIMWAVKRDAIQINIVKENLAVSKRNSEIAKEHLDFAYTSYRAQIKYLTGKDPEGHDTV